MDFRRTHLFRELARRIVWEAVLKSRGAHPLEGRKVCCSSKTISSKHKNDSSQYVRKWAGVTGDQVGWLENSWLGSNAKRKCTGSGNRDELTKEEYGNVSHMCGDGIREAKAHLALKMERDVTGNKEYFYRYVSSKMKCWQNVVSLLNGKTI